MFKIKGKNIVLEERRDSLLGGMVAERAEDAGGVQPGGAVGRLAGEVEVGELGLVVVEEEDVAGPHVPVHDGRLHLLVQVLEAPRRAVGDLHALVPGQGRPGRRVLHALLACAHTRLLLLTVMRRTQHWLACQPTCGMYRGVCRAGSRWRRTGRRGPGGSRPGSSPTAEGSTRSSASTLSTAALHPRKKPNKCNDLFDRWMMHYPLHCLALIT